MSHVFWAVGDGADGSTDAHRLADMIEGEDPTLFAYLGDIYESGTREEFAHNYAPVYGRLDDIVLATPGNHDWPNYETGYKWYFGTHCKLMRSKGTYYSYRYGSWQILAINSEEPHDTGSPQYEWLRKELDKKQYGSRRIALFHRPRYCSGSHGDAPDMEPVRDLLAAKGNCKVLLSGHAHNAQVFKPDKDGITQFISGAGGRAHYATVLNDQRLLFANPDTWGAMRFELDGNVLRFKYVALEPQGTLYEGQINVGTKEGSS